MRFIFSALLVLLLAACASGGPTASNPSSKAALADPQALADTLRKTSAAKETIDVDNSSVAQLTSADADLWARIRRGFQMPDLQSDLVDMQANWYAQRPDYVARMTERSQKYLYHIVEELEARHMPTELALLPFIESAYNPQALSVAKAAGMWQFVPGTGRTYNLKQNMWQDERRDVLASTSAALDYLSRLHDMFGDWYLALAAYNWGEGNVQRAIARNEAAGLPTDYQSLRMPNETRNYVPKLQAVKNIVMNPQQFGLALPSIPNHPYFVTVTTSHDIDVDVAARLSNISTDEFRTLNPSFKKPVILGSTQILLPFDNASAFERNLKSYAGQLSSWTTYTVDQRATPTAIAQKIGVDADTLMSVNKIPAGMRLKAGSTIVVPRTDDGDDEDISADVAESAVLAMEPDVPDTRKMLIRVRRKQSMVAVASRYGVSVGQLKAWNKTRRDAVAPGQVLVLHVPVGKAMPSEPGPERIATNVRGGGVQRIGTRMNDNSGSRSRYDKNHGRARTGVVKVAEPVKGKSSGAASKASKDVASRPKAAAQAQKSK
ncbi:transglycosylase SLT domain-containing protein [Paraburkholderia caballeronis]|uniref:Membrane-bound lytic murein transglycosylase D n=1 Tax=Paraburkholderia caballeronis TaxID=416943 RepID=A0A1H7MMR5_9BURK|nr:transglycosylase SLT domain-containing protein [Paraburkholderia caballeronis]PXW26512.1 membrane-bound lytic murein transglycosylase D [Paraburkholderia caballeronis]PXX02059.1 membrane-bound lytic murein transglycosylase D [Paraburkholderia caballeronis]RAK01216.1 membrane-bound lytic murein transglycosylase D [Paraburkholderia caballeronis]SEB91153.1 membrane-bound lytic murein transglycosylase D [Paraburkholderia caballeronis]SEL12379.1 membrane-bound lytic murein transglycosylase D [Pa